MGVATEFAASYLELDTAVAALDVSKSMRSLVDISLLSSWIVRTAVSTTLETLTISSAGGTLYTLDASQPDIALQDTNLGQQDIVLLASWLTLPRVKSTLQSLDLSGSLSIETKETVDSGVFTTVTTTPDSTTSLWFW